MLGVECESRDAAGFMFPKACKWGLWEPFEIKTRLHASLNSSVHPYIPSSGHLANHNMRAWKHRQGVPLHQTLSQDLSTPPESRHGHTQRLARAYACVQHSCAAWRQCPRPMSHCFFGLVPSQVPSTCMACPCSHNRHEAGSHDAPLFLPLLAPQAHKTQRSKHPHFQNQRCTNTQHRPLWPSPTPCKTWAFFFQTPKHGKEQ